MNDSYPSTDDRQWVQLDYAYPDAATDLNRWLPLVKWLLAIPHFIVLFFLEIAAFFAVIVTWFAILFTGRYPRGIFSFVEGVFRWHNRVVDYAFVLVSDRYPPFRLAPGAGIAGGSASWRAVSRRGARKRNDDDSQAGPGAVAAPLPCLVPAAFGGGGEGNRSIM